MKREADIDADLDAFLALARTDKLAQLKEVGAKGDITTDAFRHVVPEFVAKLLLIFSVPTAFNRLVEISSPERNAKLKNAKQFAERELGQLMAHPLTAELARRASAPLDRERESLNLIRAVGGISQWSRSAEGLMPTLRVQFGGERNRILLDSMMDWDDVGFVCTGLLGAVASHLEESVGLHEAGMLDLSGEKRLHEHMDNILRHVASVKQLAFRLGIEETRTERNPGSQDPK